MKKKTFYITTPIYYPSGNLHIGHLYTTTIAWAVRNYKKKMGYETLFLTGADEHGQKIEQKANEAKMSPKEYVDVMSKKFVKLWDLYDIDYDIFSRTTNLKHIEAIKRIFDLLYKSDNIYLSQYKGLYSLLDEEYIKETDALKIDDKFYHPQSKHELKYLEEDSFFLKISQNIKWLNSYIEKHNDFIMPKKILNELKTNFLNIGVTDLSITRTSFDWGIKTNLNDKHTIYVWLDALCNYITMLGYSSNDASLYDKYWKNGDEIVHIIGKEISRFHCIYWPNILNLLNLRQPTRIQSHGWIITSTGKMSKSKNNVVDPLELLKIFDPEVIKYFLIKKLKLENDNVFSIDILKETYNADLANTFGNLVSRTIAMFKNNFKDHKLKNIKNDLKINEEIQLKNNFFFNEYTKNMDNFSLDEALNNAINLAKYSNNYIDRTEPWKLKNESNELMIILYNLFNSIYTIGAMLEIVMPTKMKNIAKIFNLDSFNFDNIKDFNKLDNKEISIIDFKILFPRR